MEQLDIVKSTRYQVAIYAQKLMRRLREGGSHRSRSSGIKRVINSGKDVLINLYTLRDTRTHHLVSKVFVVSRLRDEKGEINFPSFLIILMAF